MELYKVLNKSSIVVLILKILILEILSTYIKLIY